MFSNMISNKDPNADLALLKYYQFNILLMVIEIARTIDCVDYRT